MITVSLISAILFCSVSLIVAAVSVVSLVLLVSGCGFVFVVSGFSPLVHSSEINYAN